MDQVRFGRALGVGARHVMKTLVTAVDAAAAEKPEGAGAKTAGAHRPVSVSGTQTSTHGAATKVAAAAKRVGGAQRGLRQGTKRFGEAVWNPFARLSGVLWLEVTGLFFGLIAVVAAQGAWRERGELHAGSAHGRFAAAAVMAAVFGYFCVSNFVRAKRRERRR